ncbi:GNAT family N-acetyltransferase [Aurantimonas sp. A2-1-M11]|uniref:GNAT family N-acetyltransferase n=1 Tax=Aurantimonas sp. A2-1-M11 TaxID=3113712 RepID=UPI002F953BE0
MSRDDTNALAIETLQGSAAQAVLDELAGLRIAVFRAFPYLYEGHADYERRYLATYAASPGAVIVAARAGNGRLVGAATGAPLGDHQPQLSDGFRAHGYDPAGVFYLGESVLLPEWRGRGVGHHFFDGRESAAVAQGHAVTAFCAVIRPADHPSRPQGYRPLDGFWRKRGYRPVPGLTATMSWRDIADAGETDKTMQFWVRSLPADAR